MYRIVYPQYGWSLGVVFTEDTPSRLLLDLMSFEKRPDWENPRQWVRGAAVAGAAAAALGLYASNSPSSSGRRPTTTRPHATWW